MLGTYLRQCRESKKIGLRKMAELTGYSPTYLSKIERGGDKPSAGVLIALAQQLGESSDTLLLMGGYVPPDIAAILQKHPSMLKAIREKSLCITY